MTQEEKQLLLKDLCSRLPYRVIVDNPNPVGGAWDEVINIDTYKKTVTLLYDGRVFNIDDIKPYLRKMSSMTKEEREEQSKIIIKSMSCSLDNSESATTMLNDWLLSKHFDVRGLISKGLALEAPEGMYKVE